MHLRRRSKLIRAPIANVIVVEGKKREVRYFEQAVFASKGPGYWTVVSADGGDPKSLLRAIQAEIANADRVYVVFDADRMPPRCSVSETETWETVVKLTMSRDPQVHLIPSYPCIEIWFLWHLTDDLPDPIQAEAGAYTSQSPPFRKRLLELMPQLDKQPIEDWRALFPNLGKACERARKARTAAVRPDIWSDIDLLIRALELEM
jgi:hypothetical protein